MSALRRRAREAVYELRTATDMVRWACSELCTADVFCGHGHAEPLDEAVHLVAGSLRLPPDVPDALWAATLLRAERHLIATRLVSRIERRVPMAYLTGRARFAELDFEVTRDVLVPRSPIAELIEAGFSPWLAPEQVTRVLEVGTGSGCIAIGCAYAFPDAQVVATDVSEAALALAARNVRQHALDERVHLTRADVFDGVTGKFDLIVSNPPYVDAQALACAPPEYGHEPLLGLAAGEDGLDVVNRILSEAAALLSDHGILVVEVGASRPQLEAAWPELPFYWPDFERGGEGVFVLERDALDGRCIP